MYECFTWQDLCHCHILGTILLAVEKSSCLTQWNEATECGMQSYWLSFADSSNKPFETLHIKTYDGHGTIIRIPGGFDVDKLTMWLYLLKPAIVHHQGHLRGKFSLAVANLGIEFVSGFDFSTGGILLDEHTKNCDILENADRHHPDPEFLQLSKKSGCHFYCASKFVQECFQRITGILIPDIIYATSSIKRYQITGYDPWNSKYVTIVNIHEGKGGKLFYYLLQKCPQISFLGVRNRIIVGRSRSTNRSIN